MSPARRARLRDTFDVCAFLASAVLFVVAVDESAEPYFPTAAVVVALFALAACVLALADRLADDDRRPSWSPSEVADWPPPSGDPVDVPGIPGPWARPAQEDRP